MKNIERNKPYDPEVLDKLHRLQIEMLKDLAEICRKYDLQYFAVFGTALGAVRHKGFIPWDDDIDVWLLRDEYERLKQVAPKEFTGKYYYQDWYNSCGRTWIFSKLRNSETTAIEYPDKGAEFNQGIFIDIFPIDEWDDEVHTNKAFKIVQRELFNCINNPTQVLRGILNGEQYAIDIDTTVELCNDYIKAQQLFEQLTLQNYGTSDIVGYYYDQMRRNDIKYPKSCFDETLYVPFENTVIPVPAGYDIILRKYYGNYMVPVHEKNNHEDRIIFDTDKPYTEYLK